MNNDSEIAEILIAMERAALDRWGQGDPGGFLEIAAPDVVYFDPYVQRRIDGIEALRKLYQGIWGKIHVDRYEMITPCVQVCGTAAVLTFNHVSFSHGAEMKWNCTEVYRHNGARWEIIQTHWSYTSHPAIVPAGTET